jgi:hypothetical protein
LDFYLWVMMMMPAAAPALLAVATRKNAPGKMHLAVVEARRHKEEEAELAKRTVVVVAMNTTPPGAQLDESALQLVFLPFGPITSVKLSGRVGMVTFLHPNDSVEARFNVDGAEIEGWGAVRVEMMKTQG